MGLEAGAPESAPRRRARFLLRLVVVLVLSTLALELALRFLLFGDGWAARAGARLRQCHLYARPGNEDDSWKLRALFSADHGARPHEFPDPELGWIKATIEPGTYRHAEEELLDGKRPLLVYGDSFAQCTTDRHDAFEALLERSELAERYALLNFGVGGYGVDQMYLLLRATIERYVERDPLVVVCILVDEDLDRTILSLRNFPKPRFTLAGDELVLHRPEQTSAAEFVAAHPLQIHSYLWRFLTVGSGLLPDRVAWLFLGEEDARAEKRALNARLLRAMRDLLVERGLDHFFVLFHGKSALYEVGPYSWSEPFLYDALRELELPFVSSKRFLLEDAAATGRELDDYFQPVGSHYDVLGNAVVFRAFLAGERGEFEPAEGYLPGAAQHPRVRQREQGSR